MPYAIGFVCNQKDAQACFQAARESRFPVMTKRLTSDQRRDIKAQQVYVYDEIKSEIHRWTDGKTWCDSYASGDFLVYKEAVQGDNGKNLREEKIGGLRKKIIADKTPGSSLRLVCYTDASKTDGRRSQYPSSPSDTLRITEETVYHVPVVGTDEDGSRESGNSSTFSGIDSFPIPPLTPSPLLQSPFLFYQDPNSLANMSLFCGVAEKPLIASAADSVSSNRTSNSSNFVRNHRYRSFPLPHNYPRQNPHMTMEVASGSPPEGTNISPLNFSEGLDLCPIMLDELTHSVDYSKSDYRDMGEFFFGVEGGMPNSVHPSLDFGEISSTPNCSRPSSSAYRTISSPMLVSSSCKDISSNGIQKPPKP
eukprot:Sdes_comp19668_c0_seq1m11524